ncbi:hypothetical protein [Paraflavitalea pollutisoli]|uniref:hypothetical protein n=1 Tax=Paraflavitalea pollutisoli TaxID=3034143 RepID=UPI0023ED9DEC|nr:hypothetical protein [Paraflavitalea sp. H1-2-19X]
MKIILLRCLPLLLLTSCVTRAIYQSPMHTNTNRYKPMPMHNEGSAAASYAGIHAAVGTANEHGQDQAFSFGTSFHRSHNFSFFQATYGATLELGDYKVNQYPIIHDSLGGNTYRNFDPVKINERAGHKFFGAYGLNGSVNVVAPFGNAEWRVLGAELAWNQEFGRYLDFRKNMPTGAVTMADRKKTYFVWGVFTEMVGRVGDDNRLGYKLALFGTNRRIYDEWNTSNPNLDYVQAACLAQTLHFTVDNKVTIAAQVNLGTYAFSSTLSTIVRLDNLRKKKAGTAAGL